MGLGEEGGDAQVEAEIQEYGFAGIAEGGVCIWDIGDELSFASHDIVNEEDICFGEGDAGGGEIASEADGDIIGGIG